LVRKLLRLGAKVAKTNKRIMRGTNNTSISKQYLLIVVQDVSLHILEQRQDVRFDNFLKVVKSFALLPIFPTDEECDATGDAMCFNSW